MEPYLQAELKMKPGEIPNSIQWANKQTFWYKNKCLITFSANFEK